VTRTLGADAELRAQVAHFVGGPCEEEQVAACFILTDTRYMVFQDKECLEVGVRVADALGRGEEAPEVMSKVSVWTRTSSVEMNGGASSEGGGSMVDEEPAAKRQKQLSAGEGGEGSGEPKAAPADGTVHLWVLWGYAGWSRCQLMGEIARGSWGLCRAVPEDVLQRGPADLHKQVYSRLIFAPKNEMSESYGGQMPAEEARRRQLRQMAIFHEILHGRIGRRADATPDDSAGSEIEADAVADADTEDEEETPAPPPDSTEDVPLVQAEFDAELQDAADQEDEFQYILSNSELMRGEFPEAFAGESDDDGDDSEEEDEDDDEEDDEDSSDSEPVNQSLEQ